MIRNLVFTPWVLARFFGGIVFILLIANLGCIFIKFIFGFTFHSMPIFHFNVEGNIPSIYSTASIFFSAVLLWAIGNLEGENAKKHTFYWKLLSCVFFFLGLDELISIHETLSDDSKESLGDFSADGYLYFAWVLPYALIFGFFLLYMLKFMFRLPKKTRMLFIVAGLVFISGAVGLEMIGGKYVSVHGKEQLTYALLTTLEELLEMVGIIIFIYALADYYIENVKNRSIEVNVLCLPNHKPWDNSPIARTEKKAINEDV